MTSFSLTKRTRLSLKRTCQTTNSNSENCLVELANVTESSSEHKTIQKSRTKMLNSAQNAARNLLKLFTSTQTPSAKNFSTIQPRIPLTTPRPNNLAINQLKTLKIQVLPSAETHSLGFTLAGYCPCHISKLEQNSPAASAGLAVGDLVIKINHKNVSRAKCESIVKIIKGLSNTEQVLIEVMRLRKDQIVINSTENNSEYAHLNQVKPKHRTSHHQIHKKRHVIRKHAQRAACGSSKHNNNNNNNKQTKQQMSDEKATSIASSYLPSPIPHMPPHSESAKCFRICSSTDSDYKTQSYTDSNSSKNSVESIKNYCHMNACETILNLEEKFIDRMQNGVQQYSRPLRHCMLISPSDHHSLFQNIEKILAISEYQLNQLIANDDAALFAMFNTIGKLYENKLRMSFEAFDIYLGGVTRSLELLNTLSTQQKNNYFSQFLSDASEDIHMDLRTFLLLPLNYVVSVHKSLERIKSQTSNDNADFQCLENLLKSLSASVEKAKAILRQFDTQDPFAEVHLASSEFVYSGQLNRKVGLRWQPVSAQLYKDRLCFSEDSEAEFETEILLSSIVSFDFRSRNEFQFTYVSDMGKEVMCFRADSLHEKLKWKCLFEGN